jgi:biotin transport system permease protein
VIGLYRPGDSPVHRAPAGLKLAALCLLATLLVALRSPIAVGVAAVAVAVGAAAARLPARVLAAQLWPLRWLLLVLVPFQWWSAGWRGVLVVVGTLVVAVAAAAVVTLTTRVSAMLDALVAVLRPLRRLGVDPDRVALVLAMTVRSVPVLAATAAEVRDARRARGLERSPRALLVPLVVRTVRHADRMGEALAARGVDD